MEEQMRREQRELFQAMIDNAIKLEQVCQNLKDDTEKIEQYCQRIHLFFAKEIERK